jgi:hypothetical protein
MLKIFSFFLSLPIAFAIIEAKGLSSSPTTSILLPHKDSHVTSPDPDMAILTTRLKASYVITENVTGLDEDVDSFLQLLTPPGIFSDLNYTPGEASNWGGYAHCTRMASFGSAYVSNMSKYYNSPSVYNALLGENGSLTWFLIEQPINPANWWYQMIGCGRPNSQLAVQFSSKLSPDQVVNITTVMYRAQWVSFTKTGTNAADIALVHIGNGLLNGNKSYVNEAFQIIWSTTVFSESPPPASPEGPKQDGSYMQHGAQLYNGNYGASWTKDCLSNLVLSQGTVFEAPPLAYGVITSVILDGCARMIHWPSAQWDVAVIGRQITNPGGQAVVGIGGDAGLLYPQLLQAAGGSRAKELIALAQALENPASSPPMPAYFAPYPATDFAVTTRATYYASVRMISARTAGGECINDQGKQSLHAADGVMYIMKTGHEYDNIAPTFDWELLPGITTQRGAVQLSCETTNGMGSGTMTGVLRRRDNETGFAFMDFNTTRYGQSLSAKKSYFLMDGFFLMIGNSIISNNNSYTVTTTMDSRLLSGDVQVSVDGGTSFSTLAQDNHSFPLSTTTGSSSPFLLATHSGMGYAVLPSSSTTNPEPPINAYLLNEPVTAPWDKVGTYEGGNQTNSMFTLWLEQGKESLGSYAYAIWPDITEKSFTSGGWKSALSRYTIWENTDSIQSVYDTSLNELSAVLYSGNKTALPLPSQLIAKSLTPPFECAVDVSLYTNGTETVFSVSFAAPSFLDTSTHAYYYSFNIDASFIPCQSPHCPGAVNMPKGYNGTRFLEWQCFSNGTVGFTNPPTQLQMGPGLSPQFNCAFSS